MSVLLPAVLFRFPLRGGFVHHMAEILPAFLLQFFRDAEIHFLVRLERRKHGVVAVVLGDPGQGLHHRFQFLVPGFLRGFFVRGFRFGRVLRLLPTTAAPPRAAASCR